VIENKAERGFAPHGADNGEEGDGHPQQRGKAPAKPMLLNAAKTTRMPIRRQKRTSTRVDLSCRGRFGSGAKTRNSEVGSFPA
jgi:hypothetical protein